MTKIQGVLSDYDLLEFSASQTETKFDPYHYYRTREQCSEFMKTVLMEIYERGVRDGMAVAGSYESQKKTS